MITTFRTSPAFNLTQAYRLEIVEVKAARAAEDYGRAADAYRDARWGGAPDAEQQALSDASDRARERMHALYAEQKRLTAERRAASEPAPTHRRRARRR